MVWHFVWQPRRSRSRFRTIRLKKFAHLSRPGKQRAFLPLRAPPVFGNWAHSFYGILTMSPRPIDRNTEFAAGMSGSKSRSRFVGLQRINNAMLRAARSC